MNQYRKGIKTLEKLKSSATPFPTLGEKARLILKGGRIIDPKNKIDKVADLAMQAGTVSEIADEIQSNSEEKVIDCSDLIVMPGLFDMHVHLGDLFEIYESPIFRSQKPI